MFVKTLWNSVNITICYKISCFIFESNIQISANSLNSVVIIYFAWSCILLSTSPIFVLTTLVVTKPLTPGILFSTLAIFVLWAVIFSERLVSGVWFSISTFFLRILFISVVLIYVNLIYVLIQSCCIENFTL